MECRHRTLVGGEIDGDYHVTGYVSNPNLIREWMRVHGPVLNSLAPWVVFHELRLVLPWWPGSLQLVVSRQNAVCVCCVFKENMSKNVLPLANRSDHRPPLQKLKWSLVAEALHRADLLSFSVQQLANVARCAQDPGMTNRIPTVRFLVYSAWHVRADACNWWSIIWSRCDIEVCRNKPCPIGSSAWLHSIWAIGGSSLFLALEPSSGWMGALQIRQSFFLFALLILLVVSDSQWCIWDDGRALLKGRFRHFPTLGCRIFAKAVNVCQTWDPNLCQGSCIQSGYTIGKCSKTRCQQICARLALYYLPQARRAGCCRHGYACWNL